VQFAFGAGEGGDEERLRGVREAILRTWGFYVQEAWGWDEVRPVKGGGRDTRYRICFVWGLIVGMDGVLLLWMG